MKMRIKGMKRFLITLSAVLALVFIVGTASAEDPWTENSDGSGNEVKAISPGFGSKDHAHYVFSDTTGSTLLDVSKCGAWSILFDPDILTDGVFDSAEIKVRVCNDGIRGGNPNANLCTYQYNTAGAVSLNGDPEQGLHKIMGSRDRYIAIEVTGNPSGDTALVTALCSK